MNERVPLVGSNNPKSPSLPNWIVVILSVRLLSIKKYYNILITYIHICLYIGNIGKLQNWPKFLHSTTLHPYFCYGINIAFTWRHSRPINMSNTLCIPHVMTFDFLFWTRFWYYNSYIWIIKIRDDCVLLFWLEYPT